MRLLLAAGAAALGLSHASAEAQPDRDVELRFAALVGDAPFRCGETYAGIGSPPASIAPQDFRFYVSDVALVARDGRSVQLSLEQDGIWQHENVALLDFEDGSGNCNGTSATNEAVRGRVPADDYVAVRFTIGVPDSLNHADATLAPSPLNYTGLFWNWRSGYIFLRLDVDSTPGAGDRKAAATGFSVHLGSVGCGQGGHGHAGGMTAPPETPCRVPNRPEFEIPGFDVDTDVIAFDVAALLAGADVTANAEGTSSGCQSMPRDGDCAAIMPTLGLPFDGAAAGAQTVVDKLRQ